jgi:predicted PurR-regulated permease PerM
MQRDHLKRTALILVIIFLSAVIVYYGRSFLIPLTFAGLLAALLLPVTQWLQRKGVNRAISILLAMMLLVGFAAGLIALLSWQISDLAKDAPQIEKQVTEQYQKIQQYISDTFQISKSKQQEIIKEQGSSAPGKATGLLTDFVAGFGGFLTDTILCLVYIFLFIYYKDHLKRFIIRIVPADKKDIALDVVHRSAKVTKQYLTGLSLMIITLWIMYGIGFSIAGVKSPIFFAILCGLLEIVPFIGNIIGTTLTVLVTLMQGGGTNVVLGILITYGIVQFVQTYILEPLVVGAEVDINPLFTVLCLVVGELFWGLPGMILAIPLMGVTKIICDHVEPLKPFGELIGGSEKKGESGFKKKMKKAGAKIKDVFN